jgi:hypothetical protein
MTEALQAILNGPDLRGRYLAARALVQHGNVTRGQREALYGVAQVQADHYALERAVKVLPETEREWLRDYLRQHPPPPGREPLILVRRLLIRRHQAASPSSWSGPERPTEARAAEEEELNEVENWANVVVMPEDRSMRDTISPLLRTTLVGGTNQNEFQAYDCSTPIDLELVHPPIARPCTESKGAQVVTVKPEVRYHLLQEAQTIEIPV